ncbi:hypothetical protein [Streptomyces sp. NPDC005827]|uniref:hypothetical protein n=1 Tax=Streptomyces sp. NPDC005827 TaxID=3157070 RepID=UPI0033C3A4A2
MFGLEYEPEGRAASDHPLATVYQAWAAAVETYLAVVAPERCAEAQVLGTHLWTAVHGQLVLWRILPHTSSESHLADLERSLLRRLLPAAGSLRTGEGDGTGPGGGGARASTLVTKRGDWSHFANG